MCRHMCHQKGNIACKAQQVRNNMGNTKREIQHAVPKHMMHMVPNTLVKHAEQLSLTYRTHGSCRDANHFGEVARSQTGPPAHALVLLLAPEASRQRGMERGGRLIFTKLNIGNLLISCGSHAHHHPSET